VTSINLEPDMMSKAIPASLAHPVPIGDPNVQFFVLKDDVALRGSDITNPQQTTDPNNGVPDVTFEFTSKGKIEFQNVTAQIADPSDLVSGLGQTLNQHFAVALDNQLITVPFIDYKQCPDGINGDTGGDIAGSLTITSAQNLANELRLGALPLNLKLICDGAPAATPCHSPRAMTSAARNARAFAPRRRASRLRKERPSLRLISCDENEAAADGSAGSSRCGNMEAGRRCVPMFRPPVIPVPRKAAALGP